MNFAFIITLFAFKIERKNSVNKVNLKFYETNR